MKTFLTKNLFNIFFSMAIAFGAIEQKVYAHHLGYKKTVKEVYAGSADKKVYAGGADKGGDPTVIKTKIYNTLLEAVITALTLTTPERLNQLPNGKDLTFFYTTEIQNKLIDEVISFRNHPESNKIQVVPNIPDCGEDKNTFACTEYTWGADIFISLEQANKASDYDLVHMLIHEFAHHIILTDGTTLEHRTDNNGNFLVDRLATASLNLLSTHLPAIANSLVSKVSQLERPMISFSANDNIKGFSETSTTINLPQPKNLYPCIVNSQYYSVSISINSKIVHLNKPYLGPDAEDLTTALNLAKDYVSAGACSEIQVIGF